MPLSGRYLFIHVRDLLEIKAEKLSLSKKRGFFHFLQ